MTTCHSRCEWLPKCVRAVTVGLSIAGLFLALTVVTACETDGSGQGRPGPVRGTGGNTFNNEDIGDATRPWPFWPQAMRVHPLTRLDRDPTTKAPLLEARIEFRDVDGIPSRCFGVVRLALHRRGEIPRSHPPIQMWERDLRDVELNSKLFDIVTQTYLFKLIIDHEDLADGETLWVMYLGGDSAQLEASMTGFSAAR